MERPSVNRTIKWAGRVIAIIGIGHLTLGMLASWSYFDDWLSLDLWGHWWEDTGAANAFWANPAGFGWPLFIVGLLVVWMERNGIVPPLFLAWMVLGWGVMCAVIVEPTPGPIVVVAAVMLLRGIRSAAPPAGTPSPDLVSRA
ncbi:DUF6463 family protein [Nocardia sp. NPDC058518]|uniref:DUF6463 family protein n=1 Tax=Nocardia sp. NPDC058518 TaxID=3346534 RepID=UPI00365171FB